MIRAMIRSTPFYSNIASPYFGSIIVGETYNGDSSFISTLRALLAPRFSDDDYLRLYHSFSTPTSSEVSKSGMSGVVMNSLSRICYNEIDSLTIHMFMGGSSEINEACVKDLYENGLSYLGDSDWKRDDVTTAMFRQRKFMVVCFVNPATRSSIVFVDGGDLAKYHTIQAAIPRFLPWYFEAKDEGKHKLSDEEFELVHSLYNGHEIDGYIAVLEKMSQKYDFKSARIKHLLGGFEKRIDEKRKSSISRDLNSINGRIDQLNREIHECIEKKREKDLLLLGIESKISQDGEYSEIMNYFLCNKALVLEGVDDDCITFGVKDYMMYFDESLIQRMIENHNSYIYTCRGGSPISGEDMARLISEIFLEQNLKLRVCAAYRMKIGGGVDGMSNYIFSSEYDGYMPNPHIQYYHCLGGYAEKLNRFMADGNYLGAFEQCMASCRSLNFGDSTVICNFMSKLYDTSTKCIELPNGDIVTQAEAISWIKGGDTTEQASQDHPEDIPEDQPEVIPVPF